MPMPFSAVCDLLEESSRLCRARKSSRPAIWCWFRRYRALIDDDGGEEEEEEEGGEGGGEGGEEEEDYTGQGQGQGQGRRRITLVTALLSTLLPEKRTDRVYGVQTATLERVVARALMLGASRRLELAAHRRPGAGMDLADCVERILAVTPNPTTVGGGDGGGGVMVEEVDGLLQGLAARTRWSAPAIRRRQVREREQERELADVEEMYRRLAAVEAKWFTRIVLKDFGPLVLDAQVVLRACDPVLPWILQIRDDFGEALGAMARIRSRTRTQTQTLSRRRTAMTMMNAGIARQVLAVVKPMLGVKVGRQRWLKGRSIKHCIDMVRGGGGDGQTRRIGMGMGMMVSVETKMDGEYCQIHVDAAKDRDRVQIFSKSGKDSTEDRMSVIPAIEKALRLDSKDCLFQKACILEGELVVYNELENAIMPFHKIRGHVTRRGHFLNTEMDSQPKPHEHLMIVYYDIFLLDDRSLMDVRHSERVKLLEQVVECQRGIAALVQRETINLNHALAASSLRRAFAKVIVDRGEGLVLKPDEPYIVIDDDDNDDAQDGGRASSSRCIKLKKEYIGSFGDVGDFALVGAGFHAAKAKTYRIPRLKWTHFFVGCLNNKDQVRRWGHKPDFTVVCAVELSEAQLRSFVALGELSAVPRADNHATNLVLPRGIQCPADGGMTVAFTNPPVVDLRCFSFDKPGNVGFWTPRFPAVSKIHTDRDYADVLSLDELQSVAREAVERPAADDESQEKLLWIAKLEGADPRGIAVDAVSSQATTMTTTTQTSAAVESQASKASLVRSRRALSPSALALLTGPEPSAKEKTTTVSTVAMADSSTSGQAVRKRPAATSLKHIHQDSMHDDGSSNSKRQHTHRFVRPRSSNSRQISLGEGQDSAVRTQQPQPQQFVIEIPSSEDEFNMPSRKTQGIQSRHRPQPSSPDKTATQPRQQKKQTWRQCKYAGADCGLRGRTILLSSATLLDVSEMTRLCTHHGVSRSRLIPCIETWWKSQMTTTGELDADDAPPPPPPPPVKSGNNMLLLLVDSIAHGSETKALIARLNDQRTAFRRRGTDWITVYDWRVLRHVSVAEDASVIKKYYDGFQDPWRRWYCGLV